MSGSRLILNEVCALYKSFKHLSLFFQSAIIKFENEKYVQDKASEDNLKKIEAKRHIVTEKLFLKLMDLKALNHPIGIYALDKYKTVMALEYYFISRKGSEPAFENIIPELDKLIACHAASNDTCKIFSSAGYSSLARNVITNRHEVEAASIISKTLGGS